jgi:hypothetical protein
MVVAYLFAIPFAFWLGAKYQDFREFHQLYHINGHCSTTDMIEALGERHGLEIPDRATNIYYYENSFLISYTYYFTLTFDKLEDCEAYLQKHHRVSIQQMHESSILPEELLGLEKFPPIIKDGWDITNYQDFLICDGDGTREKIAYVPDIQRLFICRHGGS